MIQGYLRRRKLKTVPERVMTYLAFAITKKRFNKKYRRIHWYNKAKSRRITELFDNILAGLPDVVLDELKAGLRIGVNLLVYPFRVLHSSRAPPQ